MENHLNRFYKFKRTNESQLKTCTPSVLGILDVQILTWFVQTAVLLAPLLPHIFWGIEMDIPPETLLLLLLLLAAFSPIVFTGVFWAWEPPEIIPW